MSDPPTFIISAFRANTKPILSNYIRYFRNVLLSLWGNYQNISHLTTLLCLVRIHLAAERTGLNAKFNKLLIAFCWR